MKRFHLSALMIVSASLAACAGETPADTAAETAEDAVEQAAAPETPEVDEQDAEDDAAPQPEKKARAKKEGRGHHAGPMGAVVSALREIDLSPEQEKTLSEMRQKLMADAKEKGRSHDGALAKSLAGAVESGTVNVAAFDTELDAIEARATEQATTMESALNELHAALTPEQRAELVENLQDRMSKVGERGDKGKGKAKGKRGGGALGMWGQGLDLTDAQKEKLQALRADVDRPEPDRMGKGAGLEPVLESFASDDFDAKKLGLGATAGKNARARAEQMIDSVAKAVPILDESQRAKLADMIEKRASGGPKRGKLGKGKAKKRPAL